MSEQIIVEDVIKDVKKIQDFNADSLVQKERLGEMAFDEAVIPAKRYIVLFSRLPLEAIDEFPLNQKNTIKNMASHVNTFFEQILKFSVTTPDPAGTKTQLINQLETNYQSIFDQLFPLISYLTARTVDFASLESRGHATIQSILDERDNTLARLNETSEQAESILKDVRELAAEQGVTLTAKYFGDEAEVHRIASKSWLIASIVMVLVVASFAVVSLFMFNIFAPSSAAESAQVITSKLLIFGVLVYGLFQCVRSYSAHRHNQVTNKHRQNALMTYKTLAEAGNSPELRDAVLQHAAAAIYAPNDSGYLKNEERGYGAQSLLALLPRSTGASSSGNIP
jgi:hypothetical protein